jgi:GNAT superfamily N-acetyltransferase|tara:strand:- start:1098 stop:1580 length:483 start_codon:yes stop_codon:yes gene_type:complete
MQISLINADYNNPQHAKDLLMLLNAYALDPMGGAEALSEDTQNNLVSALAKRSDALTVLCYVDNKPAGIINCFEGFSTFKCKPLMNIHDCGVLAEYRGLGLSRKLFERVEDIAKQRGCCKLTLEVLEGNEVAKSAYVNIGFSGYELDPKLGKAIFWEKSL